MVVRNKPGKRAAAIYGVAKYAEKFLWGECHTQAFLALYGIGFTTQFALISNTIERYVPIYETRNRKLGCLTEVLSDPVSYIEGKKKGRMAFPKYVGPADAAFLFALDALIHACRYREDDAILASSTVCCLSGVIDAMMVNVWQADQPLAVIAWAAANDPAGRASSEDVNLIHQNNVMTNVASNAVGKREWLHLAKALKEEKISSCSYKISEKELKKDLARWMDNEIYLMRPL